METVSEKSPIKILRIQDDYRMQLRHNQYQGSIGTVKLLVGSFQAASVSDLMNRHGHEARSINSYTQIRHGLVNNKTILLWLSAFSVGPDIISDTQNHITHCVHQTPIMGTRLLHMLVVSSSCRRSSSKCTAFSGFQPASISAAVGRCTSACPMGRRETSYPSKPSAKATSSFRFSIIHSLYIKWLESHIILKDTKTRQCTRSILRRISG